ncbi:MAG: hypothetical protein K0B01_10300 [Syntrophobacterales bacterium]|nr:hypothetical protein [Syntrophobacterales bacterium]
MENGYWTKFEAWWVDTEPHIPHGIRYSLSFHDRYTRMILGFDNAHAIRPAKKGYTAWKISWDHRHNREKVHRNIRPVVEATDFTIQFGLYGSSRSEQGVNTAKN